MAWPQASSRRRFRRGGRRGAMIYVFGDYALDTHLYELRHGGKPCPWDPKCSMCSPTSWRIVIASSPRRN